jgi:hypothetical protein
MFLTFFKVKWQLHASTTLTLKALQLARKCKFRIIRIGSDYFLKNHFPNHLGNGNAVLSARSELTF